MKKIFFILFLFLFIASFCLGFFSLEKYFLFNSPDHYAYLDFSNGQVQIVLEHQISKEIKDIKSLEKPHVFYLEYLLSESSFRSEKNYLLSKRRYNIFPFSTTSYYIDFYIKSSQDFIFSYLSLSKKNVINNIQTIKLLI